MLLLQLQLPLPPPKRRFHAFLPPLVPRRNPGVGWAPKAARDDVKRVFFGGGGGLHCSLCFGEMWTRRFPLLSVAFRRSMATARETSGASKKKVECFYDVVSPYSWLGFEIISRYRPIWNLDLHFRPVFFLGIMKATGNQPPAMLPKKGEYLLKDISRMAKYCQVPMSFPKDLVNTVMVKGSLPAMRFITAVDMTEPQFLEPVSRELWMRIWSRDEDIVQPESILAAAEKAGLSSGKSQELLKMSTSPEVKNRLKETTDEVLKFGAFGVPCFVIQTDGKPQLFFGSDRIELLGSVLGEKWLGPVPASSKL